MPQTPVGGLRQRRRTVHRHFRDSTFQLAKALERRIEGTTPVDTGELRDSTEVKPLREEDGWRVGWFVRSQLGPTRPTLRQGEAIEYGTRHMTERRVLQKALRRVLPGEQARIVRDANRWLGGE